MKELDAHLVVEGNKDVQHEGVPSTLLRIFLCINLHFLGRDEVFILAQKQGSKGADSLYSRRWASLHMVVLHGAASSRGNG